MSERHVEGMAAGRAEEEMPVAGRIALYDAIEETSMKTAVRKLRNSSGKREEGVLPSRRPAALAAS